MFKYIRDVFSNEDCASFARWSTLLTVLTGCYAVLHLVHRNGALPGAGDLLALAAWMTSPYAINKTAAALTRGPNPT